LDAGLERPARRGAVEATGLEIEVKFGREDEVRRQPAALAQDLADPRLGAAAAIDAGRVEKVDRAVEDRPDRRPRPFLAFGRVGIGAARQPARPEAQIGNGKPGPAERRLLEHWSSP